jgi:hypothetical protein
VNQIKLRCACGVRDAISRKTPKEFQRWTAKRKVELLLQLIRGERKLVDVCREHALKQSEVEGWMDTFVKGGDRKC